MHKLTLLALSVVVSSAALAQEPNVLKDCNADMKAHCKGVKPGGGRILECLAKKQAELTPACNTALAPHIPAVLAWRAACAEDLDKQCKGDGANTWATCLQGKLDTLTPACREKVDSSDGAAAMACAFEGTQQCKDVKVGDGRYVQCLDDHEAELKQPCLGWWKMYEGGFAVACSADSKKLCGGKTRYDELVPCLQANRAQLKPTCAKWLGTK
jgi:hypothetical protein